MKVVVVGRGKVGRALHSAARAAKVKASLASLAELDARALRGATLVVLAVPDAAVGPTGARVAELARGAAIVHCAGALGPEALAEARSKGADVGAMHPLVSFADAAHPPSLEGARFLVDGAPAAVERARALALALGGCPVARAAHGPVYHAAAALVANGAAALAFHAARLLESIGFTRGEATEAVASLLASVAENIRRVGVPGALTGPIARGDAGTVRAHRRAIAGDPSARAAYDGVAEAVLGCAEAAGLPPERAREVRAALTWNAVELRPRPAPPRAKTPRTKTKSGPRRPRRGA